MMKLRAVAFLLAFTWVPTVQAMEFAYRSSGGNCTGCEWISAEGEITLDTDEKFRAFLRTNPAINRGFTVVLNSGGGSLMGGLRLGLELRERGMNSSVGHSVKDAYGFWSILTDRATCASACAYAFLGGVDRDAGPRTLGFHQFYREEAAIDPLGIRYSGRDLSDDQEMVGRVALYLHRLNAHPAILFLASRTLPHDMHYLTEQEMHLYGVIRRWPQIGAWSMLPAGSGGVINTTIYYNPTYAKTISLYCRQSQQEWVFLRAASSRWTPSVPNSQERMNILQSAIDAVTFTLDGRVVREGRGPAALASFGIGEDGRTYFDYALTWKEFTRGLTSDLSITVMLPNMLGAQAVIDMPRPGLGDYANLLPRTCL